LYLLVIKEKTVLNYSEKQRNDKRSGQVFQKLDENIDMDHSYSLLRLGI